MRHTISLGLTLVVFWMLLSGYFLPMLLLLGVVSIVFVLYLSHRMDVVDHETQPVHLTTRMPSFYLWLAWEIIVSNIDVLKRVWGLKPLSPRLFVVKAGQETDIGKVIYANSITLTPGTVTINLVEDELLVHALSNDAMESLLAGDMSRRVREIEN